MSVGENPKFSCVNFRLIYLLFSLLFSLAVIQFFGCAGERGADVGPSSAERSDCVGCHTDKAMIVATAKEDDSSSGDDSGET